MRFLILSDTHGKLGVINDLAAEVGADAVIHAGDFGFYDEGSYERLSERELRLHIIHSDLEPLRGAFGWARVMTSCRFVPTRIFLGCTVVQRFFTTLSPK
jgi:hypothetical protein